MLKTKSQVRTHHLHWGFILQVDISRGFNYTAARQFTGSSRASWVWNGVLLELTSHRGKCVISKRLWASLCISVIVSKHQFILRWFSLSSFRWDLLFSCSRVHHGYSGGDHNEIWRYLSLIVIYVLCHHCQIHYSPESPHHKTWHETWYPDYKSLNLSILLHIHFVFGCWTLIVTVDIISYTPASIEK